MWILTDRQWFGFAVLVYAISAACSLFIWRQGFRTNSRASYGLLLVGFAAHSLAMGLRGFSLSRCPINNLFEATMFIGWTMAAVCLVIGAWPRSRFITAFAAPLLLAIGVFALMPALDVAGTKPVLDSALRSLHATLVLLACGSFGLGAVSALMYLTQNHNLKYNKAMAFASMLPPVQRLERITVGMLLTATVLLAAGLVTGVMWLRSAHAEIKQGDPFMVWSLVLWLFYLALCVAYWRRWLYGRRLAWGVLGGFLYLMLTFWGFYLLSPVHRP